MPPNPGIEATALGASESALSGTAPGEALHTFTLDSGASRCFFRDSTTLAPLPAPVAVRLGDPSGGPVLARSTTVLPCPAVPSGSLPGLHLPLFSTNLVSTAALQDAMVTTTATGGQRVAICTCTRTGCHLATFTLRPGSSLYTLTTEPPQVAASMSALGQLAALYSSQPALPPSPTPPCLPCVEGRQRAAPHSSFPPTTAPQQTLHMDVWSQTYVRENGRERYFLLVVDDYSRYTTVFPLCSKGEVLDVLIPWIRAVRLQLRERFDSDLPVLSLHSDRGGEFSSDLLQHFCRGEGILQSFTLLASPQQNGIAERCIGLVMELNLWPRVSLPETSPTLRWTGEVGDSSVFRVWGSRALVRDTSPDKLSSRAIPCDVTIDESVPFYRLFPYRTAPLPPPPLFLAPGPPPVDPLPPQGPSPSGVSQVDPVEPVEVAADSGAARGAEPNRAEPGGAEPGVAESEGAEPGDAEPERAELGGAKPERPEPGGTLSTGGPPAEEPAAGGPVPGGAGAAGPGGARAGGTGAAGAGGAAGVGAGGVGAGAAGGTGAAGAGGAVGVGAGDPWARGAGSGGAGVVGAGSGGTVRPRPYFVPLLQEVFGLPSSTGLTPPLLCPPPGQSQSRIQPTSPLPALSPYTEQIGGLIERREPASHPTSPVRTGRHVPRQRPPPVPGTHHMALRPSSVPQRVPLPSPPASSLADGPDPESDLLRAASPTVPRLLAIVVTGPSFESTTASALVVELVDFVVACCIVAESEFDSPPSVGEAIMGPYSSQWQTAMDAEMASWNFPGTYVDAFPPPGVNIVDGMWIFRVKRPSGSPSVFKARYVARGFSQRHGVGFFQTFSPTPKMTTLRVLLHISVQRD
ncbi:unnamed protein product [Closterium sp. NIES-54]